VATAAVIAAKDTKPLRVLHIAGLTVAAWLPEDASDPAVPAPWPILVFSHGFHGCSTQSTFLMESLARAGYAVFAPTHRDATCTEPRGNWLQRPDAPFRITDRWDETTYADRAWDIKHLLDTLASDPHYSSVTFDWRHVALIGHSLGG
jgi:predicted dienelactone hydrolase